MENNHQTLNVKAKPIQPNERIIFYNYGLGLYGQIGPSLGLLLTLAIYAVQLVLSTLWLKSYSYGPVEWVWRRLTYRR